MITLRLDDLPPSPNAIHTVHDKMAVKTYWRDYAAKSALVAKVQARLRAPYQKAAIHFHISVGDRRRHDPDNLAWAVTKPTLDGIKGFLIEDDSIDNVTLTYTYDREKPRGFTVQVTETP